jgi:hypothetical protein
MTEITAGLIRNKGHLAGAFPIRHSETSQKHTSLENGMIAGYVKPFGK